MISRSDVPAGFGVRVAAGAIDLTLLLCAAAVLTWIGVEMQSQPPEGRAELTGAMARLWREALLIPVAVLVPAAMTLGWVKVLATPGQLLMGCRVIRRRRGGPLNPYLALWRALATLALGGPVAIPLLTLFIDQRRLAAHDWVSDSMVVLEDESRVPVDQWLSELG